MMQKKMGSESYIENYSNSCNKPFYKIIFLILYSPDHAQEYVLDREAQISTWSASFSPLNFSVWVVGNPELKTISLDENILFVPCEDFLMAEKTRLALIWILGNFNFEYVVRSNTSTYFKLDRIEKLAIKLSQKRVHFGGYPAGIVFSLRQKKILVHCSGAAVFMSKDACSLAANSLYFNDNQPEDISLTNVLAGKFTPYWISRCDLELLPFWWPTAITRAKDPFDSYNTSNTMQRIHSFESARHPLFKVGVFVSINLASIATWSKAPRSLYRLFSHTYVFTKTIFFITTSRLINWKQ